MSKNLYEEMNIDTPFALGNRAFRDGHYGSAIKFYWAAQQATPALDKIIAGNLAMAMDKFSSTFDPKCYLEKYPDVARTGMDPLVHYLKYGIAEERNPNPENPQFRNRPKVLIADFRYPRYDMSAGELATYGIIKMFAELGYDVIFIPKESTELDDPYIAALRRLGVKCEKNVTYEKFKDLVLNAARDISVAYIFRPDVAELCVPCIRSVNIDAFIFYHAPDVYFRRESAQYEVDASENRIGKEQLVIIQQRVLAEINAAATSDYVVCVSNGDTDAFREALANPNLNKTGVEPPGISTFPILYLNRKLNLPEFDQTDGICFIGGSEHTPNRDAIRWFLEHVWGELLGQIPSIKFSIIGRTDPEEKSYYETFSNVIVVGWVDSIEEALIKFRLSIAPLRYGAGIKGKVGLSVISGVPCIASKVAVEDMGFVVGEEIIVAESPRDYVESILRLINDQASWARISRAGSRKAEQIYSENATFKRFIRILNETGMLDTQLYSNFASRQASNNSPIHFPESIDSKKIDVSIVIPGFNNEHMTKACLASIYWSLLPHEDFSVEVIYADDCSDPIVVSSISKKFPNALVTQTQENVGFVGNCNNGAKRASGRYVVLMNNDTIALPAWLSALFETIEAVEDCYVAGSKLLYPDSSIQEAGPGLWADGRSCMVGRGKGGTGIGKNLPEYNYVREVDYISFASVIIRKPVWDAFGGLSTEYGFGYFDDSDFCMRVRQCGGIVLYAPASEVVHNESASFSQRKIKVAAGEKRTNSAIFRRKWADALIDHHLVYDNPSWDPNYGESICKANAARHNILVDRHDAKDGTGNVIPSRRHILYFSPFPSHPANHGNQTTIQKFGQFLQAEGYAVHFVLLQSHMYSQKDARDMELAWESFDIIKLLHSPACNGETIHYDGWYVQGIGEQVAYLCSKYGVDAIICSYIFQSRLLDFVPKYILKIIDTHDKFTDRYSILDKLGKPREFFSCTQWEEGMYLSRADVVLARRDEEAAYFDSISTAITYTVPHIEERAYLEKGNEPLSIIGMVASCNLINLDIVVTFLDELIRQKHNNWGFKIQIAGEVKSLLKLNDPQQARVASHPLVHFLGFVEEIRDFYASVDMIVCPIMSGTGINVKTIQALAYGMPVIATQHASKGVPTQYPDHLLMDVPTLVGHLLSKRFEAVDLAKLAEHSRKVYENYIDVGRENFRQALRLDQPGIRKGVGKIKLTGLVDCFSRKSRTSAHARTRKQKLRLCAVVSHLDDFGPRVIDFIEGLVNIQADGGIGFWFRFKYPIAVPGECILQIGGKPYKLNKSGDELLLTISLPLEVFSQPGTLDFELDVRDDWVMQTSCEDNVRLCTVTVVR
jgi:GT2 family glycosyltransferase